MKIVYSLLVLFYFTVGTCQSTSSEINCTCNDSNKSKQNECISLFINVKEIDVFFDFSGYQNVRMLNISNESNSNDYDLVELILKEFKKFNRLETIRVSSNHNLNGFTGLKKIVVYFTDTSNVISSSFSTLPKLEELSVDLNFSISIPESILSFKKLKKLELLNIKTNVNLPDNLSEMCALETLVLSFEDMESFPDKYKLNPPTYLAELKIWSQNDIYIPKFKNLIPGLHLKLNCGNNVYDLSHIAVVCTNLFCDITAKSIINIPWQIFELGISRSSSFTLHFELIEVKNIDILHAINFSAKVDLWLYETLGHLSPTKFEKILCNNFMAKDAFNSYQRIITIKAQPIK